MTHLGTETPRDLELPVSRIGVQSWPKSDVLGIGFDLIDYPKVLETILQWRREGRRKYISITNPHSVLLCRRNEEMRQATLGADLTVPDGVGVICAARILGYPHFGRVTGPALMLRLCDFGRTVGLRHYFYGGAEGVAEELSRRFCAMFPGIIVAGLCCPPFRALSQEEDDAMVRQINQSAADVVWIGLGAPKQEIWMARHAGRIGASAMIGVGAAFDFHSGRAKWAPPWIRRLGLEWAFRLVSDPRRLWKRNLDSPRFLLAVLVQKIMGRRRIKLKKAES